MRYYRNFCSMLLIVFLGFSLIGCGADEEAVFEVSDKAPVISVEKVAEEIVEYRGRTSIKTTVKVVADRAPNSELLVRLKLVTWDCFETTPIEYEGESGWATIPKGKKSSTEYSVIGDINDITFAVLDPLPIISVVGEGEKIDQEELGEWRAYTLDEQKIPEGFQFPYYEVADTERIYLYRPKTAKLISVNPPNGSLIKSRDPITFTFDTPPYCPHLDIRSRRHTSLKGGGTEFELLSIYTGAEVVPFRFTITWGDEEVEKESSQTFQYNVFREPIFFQ